MLTASLSGSEPMRPPEVEAHNMLLPSDPRSGVGKRDQRICLRQAQLRLYARYSASGGRVAIRRRAYEELGANIAGSPGPVLEDVRAAVEQ